VHKPLYTALPRPKRSGALSRAFKRSTQLGKALRSSCFIHAGPGNAGARPPSDPSKIKTEATRQAKARRRGSDVLMARIPIRAARDQTRGHSRNLRVFPPKCKFSGLESFPATPASGNLDKPPGFSTTLPRRGPPPPTSPLPHPCGMISLIVCNYARAIIERVIVLCKFANVRADGVKRTDEAG